MDAKDKIIKAKVRLQKDNPFFAYLVMNLRFSEDESIGTIGVNMKGDCKYNAKFIESLSDESLKGVLAHEVLHLALQHPLRLESREIEIYNVACDLVINNILINSQFTLPNESGGLVPYNNKFQFPNFEWIEDLDKKTAEQVYEEICKNPKLTQKVSIAELDGKRFDKHIRGEGTPQEIKESDDRWKKAFSEASCYAKHQGKLPKGMERLLDVILNERVNWKQLLYKYLTRTLPYDYTYCLEKGTMIKTPRGEIPIEKLRQGRIIIGYKNGKAYYSKIISKFKSRVKEKYTFETATGKRIICSPLHRILTKRGYIQARYITKQDKIICIK